MGSQPTEQGEKGRVMQMEALENRDSAGESLSDGEEQMCRLCRDKEDNQRRRTIHARDGA